MQNIVPDLHREITPASTCCENRLYQATLHFTLHNYAKSYSKLLYTKLTTIHLTPKRFVLSTPLYWLSKCILRRKKLAYVKAKERSPNGYSAKMLDATMMEPRRVPKQLPKWSTIMSVAIATSSHFWNNQEISISTLLPQSIRNAND